MPGYSLYESPAELRVAKCQLHGVLVQVYGNGVLLIGDSGVGKTACAIELLRRGHLFIADDAVQIFRRGDHLFGDAPAIIRSLVHVRGRGVSKIPDLYNHTGPGDESRIDICAEICDQTDLPTMTARTQEMLEHRVPFFRINIASPVTVADRVETIVRDHTVPLVP